MTDISTLNLGIEDGETLKAGTVLKPVGSKDSSWQRGLHGTMKLNKTAPAKLSSSDFVVPPIKVGNKYIEEGPYEYSALKDPHLKKFFSNTDFGAMVVAQGLAAGNKQAPLVLDSPKKLHSRSFHQKLSKMQSHQLQEAKRNALLRNHKYLLESKESREEMVNSFRKSQESLKKKNAHMIKKVIVNRNSVVDTSMTERELEYLEQTKELAEVREGMEKIKLTQLKGQMSFADEQGRQRLRDEIKHRKMAVLERMEEDEKQLTKVKEQIEKSKQSSVATKNRIAEVAEIKREATKQDTRAFKATMEHTFSERRKERERENAERARRLEDERRRMAAERETIELEQRTKANTEAARRRAEFAQLRRKNFETEQARKLADLQEKQRRREAKERFNEQQEQKRVENRERVMREKAEREALEEKQKKVAEKEREAKKQRNALEKKKRFDAMEQMMQQKAEQRRREADLDLETQNAIKESNAAAYRMEQEKLWREAMQEAEREEKKRAREKKQAEAQAELKKEEEEKQQQAHEAQKRRAAAEKAREKAKLNDEMKRMEEEVQRQIANMKKGL
eukprot:m.152774 g.152774  ORF g.152774 m.152774 type:complete len:566 (+) comp30814_c0_seq2:181-1878(+)